MKEHIVDYTHCIREGGSFQNETCAEFIRNRTDHPLCTCSIPVEIDGDMRVSLGFCLFFSQIFNHPFTPTGKGLHVLRPNKLLSKPSTLRQIAG